jgi:hypothetical protein
MDFRNVFVFVYRPTSANAFCNPDPNVEIGEPAGFDHDAKSLASIYQ